MKETVRGVADWLATSKVWIIRHVCFAGCASLSACGREYVFDILRVKKGMIKGMANRIQTKAGVRCGFIAAVLVIGGSFPIAADEIASEFCGRIGLKMSAEVRRLFLSRAGTDSRQIVSELEKLKCYCGDAPEATPHTVSVTEATQESPAASPSSPSIRLKAFMMPTTHPTVSGRPT